MLKFMGLIMFCAASVFCFGQSAAGMNDDAGSNYQKADKELNAVYQHIVKDYKADTTFTRKLKIAQSLWIKFRDAEVEAKYPDAGGYGSVEPMCRAAYLTDLTKERTEKLKIWLTGIEEGDVCAGSVKIKN